MCHLELDSFPILNHFPNDSVVIIYDFLILYNKRWQHSEDLYNSVNQYFPNNDYTMLQNHAWTKDPVKLRNRPRDCNITKYEKFNDIISDSTWQLTFTKPPFVNFCVVPKNTQLPKKGVEILLPFLTKYLCEDEFSS